MSSSSKQGSPDHTGTSQWALDDIVGELRQARRRWREAHGRAQEAGLRELPSREALREIMSHLSGALFPMRLGPHDLREQYEDFYVGHTLGSALNALRDQTSLELRYLARLEGQRIDSATAHQQATGLISQFAAQLPALREMLDSDVLAAFQGDPAARSVDEVLLCYPGIVAIIHHRLAHTLYRLGVPILARMIAEDAHSVTGIDIHPGAQIGSGFFIDHGTGVVIGETCIIGQNVRLYQAVTLGAVRFPADENGHLKKGQPRHPVVEDDVVIYAGATLLGRITIGQGSTIGGNVWLTQSVPAGSQVTQAGLRNACNGEQTTVS